MLYNNLLEYFNNYSLLESSFYDFTNPNTIVTKSYIENFINSDNGSSYLDYFISLYNLDSDNSDSISTSLEFYDFIKELLLSNFDIACTNIYNNIHNDNIHIYRAITVDDDWIEHLQKQGRRLGIYWSYESNGAITHCGNYNKPKTAFITAIINQKYVDWKTTLELNTDPVYSEEKEIRLYKNTPIKILDITVDNISYNIPNKIFIA